MQVVQGCERKSPTSRVMRSFFTWFLGTTGEHDRAKRKDRRDKREAAAASSDLERQIQEEKDEAATREARRAYRVHEDTLRKFAASKRKDDES